MWHSSLFAYVSYVEYASSSDGPSDGDVEKGSGRKRMKE